MFLCMPNCQTASNHINSSMTAISLANDQLTIYMPKFVFIFQYIAGQSEFFLFSSACFHHFSDIRTKYPNECQRFDRLTYIQSKGLASVSIEIYGIYVMRAFDSNAQKEFICIAAYQYFVSVHCYHFSFSPSLHQNGVFCFVSYIFFLPLFGAFVAPGKSFCVI